MDNLDLRGFYFITKAECVQNEKNKEFIDDEYITRIKSREGKLVVFPYCLKVGNSGIFLYAYDKHDLKNNKGKMKSGKHVKTSTIQKIEIDSDGGINVYTMSTYYRFEKYC